MIAPALGERPPATGASVDGRLKTGPLETHLLGEKLGI